MEKGMHLGLYRRYILGIRMPPNIERFRGKAILHFSDTPSTFYGAMRHIIALLNPLYIVHTGDLADEIKLELHPGELPLYKKKLVELVRVLSPVQGDRVVIVIGNHDHEESVRGLFPGGQVLDGRGRVDLLGMELNLSHTREDLLMPLSRFNLFGHSCPLDEQGDKENILLNGLHAVHALHVESGEVLSIAYPAYVDDARFNRKKIGL
ncbi:MAG: metallophosphoesterase [Synergistaceae bacterium]|nr:metallophosphoesterase [Synergistaceae bacterium]